MNRIKFKYLIKCHRIDLTNPVVRTTFEGQVHLNPLILRKFSSIFEKSIYVKLY